LRFMKGDISNYVYHLSKEINPKARQQLVSGQKPHATIITCSDSRVPPELIFNKGLGSVFIIRLAGNIVDDFALGSIEYGIHHLHTPLILIMGHQNCGAVKATNDSKGNLEGEGAVPSILKEIWPVCEKPHSNSDPSLELDAKIQRNIRHTKEKILSKSKIVRELMEAKKVGIVLAEYYFDTGKASEIADTVRDSNKISFEDTVTIKSASGNSYLASHKGSGEHQVVYASSSDDDNSKWIIRGPTKSVHHVDGNPVSEGDLIRLEHKATGKHLHIHAKSKVASAATPDNAEESYNLEVNLKLEGKRSDISLKLSSQFALKDVASKSFLNVASSHVKVEEKDVHEIGAGDKSFWVIEKISN